MDHQGQSVGTFVCNGQGPGRGGCRARHRDSAADGIVALISAHHGVPPVLLLHRSRCRAPVARARQLAMYLMHTLLGRTMTEVGRYFGRDRTTVAHACGRIEDKRDDVEFDRLVSALEEWIAASAVAEPGREQH